jgi:hypothetical protein
MPALKDFLLDSQNKEARDAFVSISNDRLLQKLLDRDEMRVRLSYQQMLNLLLRLESPQVLLHAGDTVKIVKPGSNKAGKKGLVTDPDWTGRVKIELVEGGEVRSYLRSELLVEAEERMREEAEADDVASTATVVRKSQKAALQAYREKHGITDETHEKMLARTGWSVAEFERGEKRHRGVQEGKGNTRKDGKDGFLVDESEFIRARAALFE